MRLFCATLSVAALLLQHSASSAPAPKRELAPLPASKTALVRFEISPFPYRGEVPEKNQPFLDVVDGERRGHHTARGGTYWEDQTYSDQRVLLHIPRLRSAPTRAHDRLLHGNEATLSRDVRERQQVPRQSPNRGSTPCWWRRNSRSTRSTRARAASGSRACSRNHHRGGRALTVLYGDERARGVPRRAGGDRGLQRRLQPGGVRPACRPRRRPPARRGAVRRSYGQFDKFADWRASGRRPSSSAASARRRARRTPRLQRMLRERGVRFQNALPANLTRGSVTFVDATDDIKHVDFMTEAWVDDPLKVVLREFPASRAGGAPAGATAKPK